MTRRYANGIEFLKSKFTAVVSTVSPEGKPQSATVLFWVGSERGHGLEFFFMTRRHTRKAANIAANDAVALVVGTDLEPYSVQAEGRAEAIEEGNSLTELWNMALLSGANPQLQRMFSGQYFPAAPFHGLAGTDFVVYRVRPSWARFMAIDPSGEITYTELA